MHCTDGVCLAGEVSLPEIGLAKTPPAIVVAPSAPAMITIANLRLNRDIRSSPISYVAVL
jgi:hypothetical protein